MRDAQRRLIVNYARAITLDELEAALNAQVMWGARLGIALVELGSIDLDSLSNALAAQHHVPAALANHFDRADRSLQLLLSASLAERFECVPLSRVGKRAVVVAAVSPLDPKAIAILADELGVEPASIIFAVAPELRIRYALERVYKIARPQRFLRAPGSPNAPKKQIALETQPLELDPVDLVEDDDLPDDAIPIHTDPTPSERRSYVPLIATAARSEIATSRTKTRTPRAEDSSEKEVALEAIRTAPDREAVARLMIEAVSQLEPATRAWSLARYKPRYDVRAVRRRARAGPARSVRCPAPAAPRGSRACMEGRVRAAAAPWPRPHARHHRERLITCTSRRRTRAASRPGHAARRSARRPCDPRPR